MDIDNQKFRPLDRLRLLTDKLNERDQELHNQQTRLKLALKAAHLGMWHWCPVKDLLIWDRRMFEMFRPDLLGKIDPSKWKGSYADFIRCVHPDDVERINGEIDASLKQGKYYNVKYRVVHRDGTIRHIKALGEALNKDKNDCHEACLTGVCFDITDEVNNA